MKNGMRFIGFCVVFALIFALVQHVFVPKVNPWEGPIQRIFTQFYHEPKNSIDVLFLGPSGIERSFLPPVFWKEKGISSYNLGISVAPNAVMYYWLDEVLKYQSPKIVVISERGMFYKQDFDTNFNEIRFRYGIDNMRWSKNKIDSIMDILAHSEKQNLLNYVFPLLRFHNRQDITRDDYGMKFLFERYQSMVRVSWTRHIPQVLPSDFFDIDNSDNYPNIDIEYMSKIVEVCPNNNNNNNNNRPRFLD